MRTCLLFILLITATAVTAQLILMPINTQAHKQDQLISQKHIPDTEASSQLVTDLSNSFQYDKFSREVIPIETNELQLEPNGQLVINVEELEGAAFSRWGGPKSMPKKKTLVVDQRFKSEEELNNIILTTVIQPLNAQSQQVGVFSRREVFPVKHEHVLQARKEGQNIRLFEIYQQESTLFKKLVKKGNKPLPRIAFYKGQINAITGEIHFHSADKDGNKILVDKEQFILFAKPS